VSSLFSPNWLFVDSFLTWRGHHIPFRFTATSDGQGKEGIDKKQGRINALNFIHFLRRSPQSHVCSGEEEKKYRYMERGKYPAIIKNRDNADKRCENEEKREDRTLGYTKTRHGSHASTTRSASRHDIQKI